MRKSVLALCILVSTFANADAVPVLLNGQEVASTNEPAKFNVHGDTVVISEPDFEATIYTDKDFSGQNATLKKDDPTPFSFRSIDVVKSAISSLGGLYFEVRNGTPCVSLALELQGESGSQNLYADTEPTYNLPELEQPNSRQFKQVCSTDGTLDINKIAVDKLGEEATLNQSVLLTVFSKDTKLNQLGGYNYYLVGHLPTTKGGFGRFTPDMGFDYMGNYADWRNVLELKETPEQSNAYIVSGIRYFSLG